MKLRVWLILLCAVFLIACGKEDSSVDIKELVNEYSVGTFEHETASITSTQLIVTDQDKNERTYVLPEDEFFISIAPFIDQTHPCDIHSLTGCQGEMIEEDFEVYIEDEDGNVIVNETLTTYANGFIDVWLPRDTTFHIKVTHGDKQGESTFQTFENDGTCMTTLQLT